jgi:hypothetical protein
MASTAKALRRQHDHIIRLCAPVLRLHSASPHAFDELMNQVGQQLQRLQREVRIKRDDIRAQSLARLEALVPQVIDFMVGVTGFEPATPTSRT